MPWHAETEKLICIWVPFAVSVDSCVDGNLDVEHAIWAGQVKKKKNVQLLKTDALM